MTSATTTITNHTTTCWACAEQLPRGATKCLTCGELQVTKGQPDEDSRDVDGWDGERLSLRLGGNVPSGGCCVGCGREGAGLVRKSMTHIPGRSYLLLLPFLALGPIIYLLLATATQQKTTIGLRACYRCRGRELGFDFGLFALVFVLMIALPMMGMSIGDWFVRGGDGAAVGVGVGFVLWTTVAIYAKGWLAPRTAPFRSHGMDERSVQLSFRCPQALRI